MISVREADKRIHDVLTHLMARRSADQGLVVPLREALGHILHEPILADRPYPPFERVAMDGIALRFAAWSKGQRSFPIRGMQRAGDPRVLFPDLNGCFEVMTGARLPDGADVVIPYENLKLNEALVELDERPVLQWQNIHRQGSDCRTGQVLVTRGSRIGAPETGVAAAVGRETLNVEREARVALVSTGDELVPVSHTPLEHQIRASNMEAVQSLLSTVGIRTFERLHLHDSDPNKFSLLNDVLERVDVLILSGGVSAGKFDFVPALLADLRVESIFHKVAQRPGKPLLFGLGPTEQLVFALPGNPASALICARRYVLPALRRLRFEQRPSLYARLAKSIELKNNLTLFLPVTLQISAQAEWLAQSVVINGSGDFAGLTGCQGFVELSGEQSRFAEGESVPLYLWENF